MKHTLLYILLSALFLLSGCSASSAQSEEPLKMTGMYFDTVVTIEIWGTTDETLLTQCKDLCEYYEQLLSRTVETSDVAKINTAGGNPVTVSWETAALIEKSLEYSRLTDGLFDITIAPLTELWDISHNPGNIPDESAISEAVSHVGYENILVKGNSIQLKDPQASIDLGGIAKGYIADKLKEFLEKEGVSHGLINLGGNVLAIGGKMNGEDFHIGLQMPFEERNMVITDVDIRGKSVVSSGTYERYFEKDGHIYHHILNPETGYPYESNILQVTIISDSSTDGDALSTSCFALGLEEGSRLIESLDHVRAIYVTDDFELHYVG